MRDFVNGQARLHAGAAVTTLRPSCYGICGETSAGATLQSTLSVLTWLNAPYLGVLGLSLRVQEQPPQPKPLSCSQALLWDPTLVEEWYEHTSLCFGPI